jgi:uncharacterized protein (DUF362 family)
MTMDVHVYRDTPDYSFIKVQPGDWVVLKPNLVRHEHYVRPTEWEPMITSASVIRGVADYVAEQLRGRGKITICDAPQTDASFERIEQLLQLRALAAEVSKRFGVPVEVVDLRNEEWTVADRVVVNRRRLAGDPRGAIAFNLGRDSLFYRHRGEGRYYGADYDEGVVNSHHSGDIHEYLISATPIQADVFINIPKLKTHKKSGVTLSLKNLVGINADKNWLPHHTNGAPSDGGDQYPELTLRRKLEQRSVAVARRLALSVPVAGPYVARKLRRAGTRAFGDDTVIRSGNWHGNDTTWRMVLDLNRCLLYGNPDGTLRREAAKRYYSVVDGVIGMDGAGPMAGDRVDSGVVIGGVDPVAVDMVAARVMGFDWRKLPVIREAFVQRPLPVTRVAPEDVYVVSDDPEWTGRFLDVEPREFLHFRPHFGWTGRIEYGRAV